MRASLLAAIPFAALAVSAMPAAADTVVQREVVIMRDVPTRVVERRYYRAPEVRYYSAPRTTYAAPSRYYYASVSPRRDFYYAAPRYNNYVSAGYYDAAPRYAYRSTYYYSAPADDYDTPGFAYVATGNGCDALYRRAVATNSTYWWDRYSECAE